MKFSHLAAILIFSSVLHAANPQEVTEWTKNTLMTTLSVDFNYNSMDVTKYRQGFTPYAWNALSGFLGVYLQQIHAQQLILHPKFLKTPTIVDSGIASGIQFWRVNEEIVLPEIKVKIAFSLIVIATNPTANGSYIIQNMSMIKEEN
ncbi:hypothetical protein [Legionella sp.]|uniref:hypothetical protein n=1 Tax=Legionella sp. TaxID=459 RepID=UPI003CBCC1F4